MSFRNVKLDSWIGLVLLAVGFTVSFIWDAEVALPIFAVCVGWSFRGIWGEFL